jgi:hypothetical protein
VETFRSGTWFCGTASGIGEAALASEPDGVSLAKAGKTRWSTGGRTMERFAAAGSNATTRVTGASLAVARTARQDYVIQIGLRETDQRGRFAATAEKGV